MSELDTSMLPEALFTIGSGATVVRVTAVFMHANVESPGRKALSELTIVGHRLLVLLFGASSLLSSERLRLPLLFFGFCALLLVDDESLS